MNRFLARGLLTVLALGASSAALGQGVGFNPASLDFGVLPPKTKKQLTIQVTAPAGAACTLTKPPRFVVTPDTFTGAASPVTLTVEFDNSALIQQEQVVSSVGFVEVKCGKASGKFNVKGSLEASAPRPIVQLTQKGQPDGQISFTVQGDPQNPKPFCGQAGGGAGAFGSTGSVSFSCGDKLHIGSVATFEIKNSTRFLKFSGGTGSGASCNGSTSTTCSFTVGSSGGSIVAEYKPPDPLFRVRLKRDGDGAGTVEGTNVADNKRVVLLTANDKSQTGSVPATSAIKVKLKASPSSGSSFLGYEVIKPSGINCQRKSDECTFDLNPATLEYEIEVKFKKGSSAKGSN